MTINKTVLYHAHCPDGFAAAYACWLEFKDTAQYIPVLYGQPCPEIPPEHQVYIVDFSYDKATLQSLLAARLHLGKSRVPYVTVLDHHLSAQRDLQSLVGQDLRGMEIRFDMEESGATLAWKHLHGYMSVSECGYDAGDMPRFFKYIRDRDLWQWQLPHSKAVSLAYYATEKTFEAVDAFARQLDTDIGLCEVVAAGEAMERYAAILVREQAERAVWGFVGGYRVPIVNATALFHEVGNTLCEQFPEAPFCAYYFMRADGQVQWGLRSKSTEAESVDCSLVAKQYGGGGHRQSSGFTTNRAGWQEIMASTYKKG